MSNLTLRRTLLLSFTQQWSALMAAKLPLIRTLQVLGRESDNRTLRSLIQQILIKLEDGQALHRILTNYSKTFSNLYVQLVKIGEETGQLDAMLARLSRYLNERDALRQQLIQAMIYPAVIVGVTILAVIFLFVYIVPEFEVMFSDYNAQLPAITRIVISFSDFFVQWGWMILIVVIGLLIIFLRLMQNASTAKRIYRFIFKFPAIGPFLQAAIVAQISQTLSTLLEARVSMLHAIQITRDSIDNPLVKRELKRMASAAERGERLTDSVTSSTVFPAMMTQMLLVGEETANIDRMLADVADYYQTDVTQKIQKLVTLIEPLIIVTLGFVIGFIVIAIYLPMFELSNVMY